MVSQSLNQKKKPLLKKDHTELRENYISVLYYKEFRFEGLDSDVKK